MLHVGLMDEIQFFLHRDIGPQNPPVITCKTIYKDANNFVEESCLSMTTQEYPGMTVFTKFLVGSAYIESCDWVQPHIDSVMLAKKVMDDHLKAQSADTWVLFPDSSRNWNHLVIVIFQPTGGVMPLHDHPGMTVFTKLLVGSAYIESCDWVQPRIFDVGLDSVMLAEKVRDDRLKAQSAGAWVLSPDSSRN
ncbi:hypothetical protein PR202_ga12866 [Eleusine coracana subsp. coracana]|uniref:cysteine dioxygenase n=1 Tax=Eleusine coracana subsp. coracana TaxID=191504 RepID=A0AAV5CD35_ELECO|nr:hypothetical protein PR202_ga12866 [Eleusine coracana subsp. coracana]